MIERRVANSAAALLWLALGITLGLAGCASKPVAYSDFDEETNFSSYHNFAWISQNPLFVTSPGATNPALESILKDEVRSNLTGRGFQYTSNPEEADFVIGFTVGGQDTMRTTVYSQRYRSSWIVGGHTFTQIGVHSQDSTTGGIVIDVFDQAKAEKKWMGWAIQEITMNDRRFLQDTVRELVTIILAEFPPA